MSPTRPATDPDSVPGTTKLSPPPPRFEGMTQRSDRLQVEVRVGDRAVDVRVAGEVDIATVGEFRSALWAQPARPLLRLDLSEVPLFSAVAIRTLIAAHLAVRARGGSLVLVDPHPMVLRVLRGTGLHRVVPVIGRASRLDAPAGGPPATDTASAPTAAPRIEEVSDTAAMPADDALPASVDAPAEAGPGRALDVSGVPRVQVSVDRRLLAERFDAPTWPVRSRTAVAAARPGAATSLRPLAAV